jgi:SAM-dependent methyltransferase
MTTADELVTRIAEATAGALELFSIHLGRALGLYPAVAAAGPDGLTYADLAARCGIGPRHAREWLEQQAVAGLLQHVPGDVPPEQRRYLLPAAHHGVLVDGDAADHVAPFADLVAGIGGALPAVARAFREDGGVPYRDYGGALRAGQGAINRPLFAHELDGWFDAAPDLAARLDRPAARIADVGCGEGWSTVALARRFPAARVDGFDADKASVEAARRRAGGLARVSFHERDAAALDGRYDLVFVFEPLHDFARPVEVLRRLRGCLADGGAVLIADERVADAFTAPGDLVERMMYGWSVTHCLPASLADAPSAGLGTVLRRGTVRRLAAEAGFGSTAELPIDNRFLRFYLLAA